MERRRRRRSFLHPVAVDDVVHLKRVEPQLFDEGDTTPGTERVHYKCI